MSSNEKQEIKVNRARRHFLGLAAATSAKATAVGAAVTTILPSTVSALGRKLWPGNGGNGGNGGNHEPGGSPMCFLRGTAIATSTGEICVEHLRIGDRVRTARGEVLPVRWIGRHSYRCSGSSWNKRVVPIGIARHAIDEKTPHRNLYLSPGHCLLIDGVLIQAVDLVNDVTIAPVAPATDETIDYFHIVLDRHDVILAEGAAAETLRIQAGNHEGFVNFAEFERLYPDRAHARMALVAPIVGYGGRAHLKALLRLAAGRRAAGAREAAERIFEKLARRAERLPG